MKSGRWRKDACLAASCHQHWRLMHILHITRAPSMHLMIWLEKTKRPAGLDPSEAFKPGSQSAAQMLVYRKADSIRAEYDNMFKDEAYMDPEVWACVWEHVDNELELPEIRSQCVFLALEAANDFEMRVVKRVEAMSMQILWLVYEKPHVHCRHRLRIATDLLRMLTQEHDSKSEQTFLWKSISLLQTRAYGLR